MNLWVMLAATAGLGALGALARYVTAVGWVRSGGRAATAIAVVNSVGCFALGLLGALPNAQDNAVIATALVGSLTTLSSLSADVAELARSKKWRAAGSLLALHVVGGLGGFGLGYVLGQSLGG